MRKSKLTPYETLEKVLHSQLPLIEQRRKKTKKLSKNTAYKRGRQFEYRVQNHFRKLGYYVKRSYASKGAEDLIAIKQIQVNSFIGLESNPILGKSTVSEVLLIQCKNLKVEKPLSKLEKDNLKLLAKQTGGTPIHAFNRNHKLILEEVI